MNKKSQLSRLALNNKRYHETDVLRYYDETLDGGGNAELFGALEEAASWWLLAATVMMFISSW